ncbi:hypothetical protein ACLUW2_09640 [Limosilactobacillus balticus]|uniref:hypothetical protein n=1 Tax=Limosilactobacillus balticus TaxID=2759747 RepID=UPI003992565A
MELRDIKTLDDLQDQIKIYGTMIEQLGDNLQDLKKVEIAQERKENGMVKALDEVQQLLYEASRKLASYDD